MKARIMSPGIRKLILNGKYETILNPSSLDEVDTKVIVSYHVDPPEPATREYPGSDGSIEFSSITDINGKEIVLTQDEIDSLETDCWEYVEGLLTDDGD
jgi:hypothetical protein